MFGLGPLSSVLPGAEDATLPACCRRNGAHHCAMAAQMAAHLAASMAAVESDGKTSVTAPTTCPYYPGASIALLMPAYALVAAAEALPQPETGALLFLPGAPAHRSGLSGTHAGRGPPATS